MISDHYFPNQIDNFFEDPKKIVKFANTLQYNPCPDGKWPGVRSTALHKANYSCNSVLGKIFSLFFDYNVHKINWKNVRLHFQKTYPYDPKDKNNIVNHGLVHCDGTRPMVGLVYLTEGVDIESGTSIMDQVKKDKKLKYENIKKYIYKKLPKILLKRFKRVC